MFNLHETFQIKVYDNMHNVVNTETFNAYPTVEQIQNTILAKNNGVYAKVEKRYYTSNTNKESHMD